jgi:endonuclease YncB( thermonuclease family)
MNLTRALLIATAFVTSNGATSATDLIGRATIIDGDTLEIHGARVRLWGVDAPESSQLCRGEDSLPYRCGARAANELAILIGGRPVSCTPMSLDRYGRTVASCAVGSADLWPIGSCARVGLWIGGATATGAT